MAAKKKYTENDNKNIISLFLSNTDNRSKKIAEISNCNLTYVNRVINNHLKTQYKPEELKFL